MGAVEGSGGGGAASPVLNTESGESRGLRSEGWELRAEGWGLGAGGWGLRAEGQS